jgi:hypothetical protein
MKTVKSIKEKPTAIVEGDGINVPTFQNMMRYSVGMNVSGEKSIDAVQVGLKLSVEQDEVQLEDAEFELLKSACRTNPMKYGDHFQGQLMTILKAAENGKHP